MKKINKLNFGCGMDIKKDYVNFDHFNFAGVDVIHDFEKFPYPFQDNQFEEIYCSHVLEHTSDLVKVIEEFGRISKNNCIIKVLVPYFSSPNNALDPTHKRQFNCLTFSHFEHGYISKTRLKLIKRKIIFFSCRSYMKSRWYSLPFDLLINIWQLFYERFFSYMLPASEIHYLLEIKK